MHPLASPSSGRCPSRLVSSPFRRVAARRPRDSAMVAGFTLIELLTVIAIIGILAAIIIPTVGEVRKTAKAAVCKSNLRQMGMAFNLYANANKGFLPAPRANPGDWYNDVWVTAIQPYMEGKKPQISDGAGKRAALWDGVSRCPGKPDWNIDGPTDVQRVSYSMATHSTDGGGVQTPRRLTQFIKPTITALVVDSNTGNVYIHNNNHMYRDFIALWHKERDNVLFVDGHVEAVAKNGLNYRLLKSADNEEKPW